MEASFSMASGYVSFSISIINFMASPLAPHPKQWYICLLGLTTKEGVFSL